VPALTVGITSARNPACKRGIAVNLAASLAREPLGSPRVCVVDADPLNRDVTTRLTVPGPVLEDFADRAVPASSALGSVHEPPLWVLPNAGAGVELTRRAASCALRRLRQDFDVVICDLPGGSTGSARVVRGRLDQLDWLLVAVTPQEDAVADAVHFVAQLRVEAAQGAIADTVGFGVVITGDEGSAELSDDAVAARLSAPVVGSVRQLWGRSAPNLGFGAALGIADLDDAVGSLFVRLAPERLDQGFADLGAH
jgi:Mrp family chromosome partitioning ATPase